MREALKQQEHGARNVRMLRAQSIRTLARHTSPGDASFERRHDCRRHETKKKAPKQRQTRFGQLTRPTGVSRASGRRSNHCGNVSSGGGNWTPPQQPCSRPHHKTGQVRLPGWQGLDDTSHPGRRRADARWKEARSFGGLRVKNRSLDLARPLQPRGPVRRKPDDDFVILFYRESLALTDPQEEPTIGSAEATDCGFVQLACLAIGSDQAEQM